MECPQETLSLRVSVTVLPDETDVRIRRFRKADCPPGCVGPRPMHWGPWIEQKAEEGGVNSMFSCLTAGTETSHHLLHLKPLGLIPWLPLVLRPWTHTQWHTSFPGFPAHRSQMAGCPAPELCAPIPLDKSPLGSVPLENLTALGLKQRWCQSSVTAWIILYWGLFFCLFQPPEPLVGFVFCCLPSKPPGAGWLSPSASLWQTTFCFPPMWTLVITLDPPQCSLTGPPPEVLNHIHRVPYAVWHNIFTGPRN